MTSQCDEIFVAVRPRLNHALGSKSEAAIINLDVVKATRWHRNAIDKITLVRIKPFILLISIIITIVKISSRQISYDTTLKFTFDKYLQAQNCHV